MVEIEIYTYKLNKKEHYISFCNTEETIPVFQSPWWLDAVVGRENWDVILSITDGEIVGAMPYYIKSKLGFTIITMPRFVSMMGIWIKYPSGQTQMDKLHYEQTITQEIIDQLPKFDYFNQNFNYSFTNWLPFYWKGFQQTTRYTYILEDFSDLDSLFKEFALRRKKITMKSLENIQIKDDLSVEKFYDLHKLYLAKKGKSIEYSVDLLKRMVESSIKNNSGKLLYAVDETNEIHAALFTIWNKASAFNLINPINPDSNNRGASTLLIMEMIKFLKDKTNKVDFDGSMNKQISESFRRFGAVQTPYFVISKTNSILYKTYRFLFKN